MSQQDTVGSVTVVDGILTVVFRKTRRATPVTFSCPLGEFYCAVISCDPGSNTTLNAKNSEAVFENCTPELSYAMTKGLDRIFEDRIIPTYTVHAAGTGATTVLIVTGNVTRWEFARNETVARFSNTKFVSLNFHADDLRQIQQSMLSGWHGYTREMALRKALPGVAEAIQQDIKRRRPD